MTWTVHVISTFKRDRFTGGKAKDYYRTFEGPFAEYEAKRYAQNIVEAGPAAFASVTPPTEDEDAK